MDLNGIKPQMMASNLLMDLNGIKPQMPSVGWSSLTPFILCLSGNMIPVKMMVCDSVQTIYDLCFPVCFSD